MVIKERWCLACFERSYANTSSLSDTAPRREVFIMYSYLLNEGLLIRQTLKLQSLESYRNCKQRILKNPISFQNCHIFLPEPSFEIFYLKKSTPNESAFKTLQTSPCLDVQILLAGSDPSPGAITHQPRHYLRIGFFL